MAPALDAQHRSQRRQLRRSSAIRRSSSGPKFLGHGQVGGSIYAAFALGGSKIQTIQRWWVRNRPRGNRPHGPVGGSPSGLRSQTLPTLTRGCSCNAASLVSLAPLPSRTTGLLPGSSSQTCAGRAALQSAQPSLSAAVLVSPRAAAIEDDQLPLRQLATRVGPGTNLFGFATHRQS